MVLARDFFTGEEPSFHGGHRYRSSIFFHMSILVQATKGMRHRVAGVPPLPQSYASVGRLFLKPHLQGNQPCELACANVSKYSLAVWNQVNVCVKSIENTSCFDPHTFLGRGGGMPSLA